MYEQITEVPFIASTTADRLLAGHLSLRRAREKLRQKARERFALPETPSFSFGRSGRAYVEPLFLYPYLTLLGTAPDFAESMGRDMEKYGVLYSFSTELRSIDYEPVVRDFLTENFKLRARPMSLASNVNFLLARLTLEDSGVHAYAQELSERWRIFSRSEKRFNRLPGQLVRIEDEDALISVWNEEESREELRSIEASQLLDIGGLAEGDPLILYEVKYGRGISVSIAVPAVLPDEEAKRALKEDAELLNYETRLPSQAQLESEEYASVVNDRNSHTSAAAVTSNRTEKH